MPIYGLNLLISHRLETMYVASGAWYTYQVCSNDDIGLLLDFLWQIDFALVTTEDYGMKAILGPLTKKITTVPAT